MLEYWNDGKMERWKIGTMDQWNSEMVRSVVANIPSLHYSNQPVGNIPIFHYSNSS